MEDAVKDVDDTKTVSSTSYGDNDESYTLDEAIRNAADKQSLTLSSSSLYSDIYLVMPLLIPPLERDITIEAKLLSCPTSATPVGPMMEATTLTLINPVSIFTKVDMAVKEKTFTISAEVKRLHRESNLRINTPMRSATQPPSPPPHPSAQDSSVSSTPPYGSAP